MTSDTTRASESADLAAELEARLKFETLISDLSSKFINLPADQVDSEIVATQGLVCKELGLDVSSLWQWEPDVSGDMVLTHYFAPPHMTPPAVRMDARDHFPWGVQEFLKGRIVAVSSVDRLGPEAARDVATWRGFGIKSALHLPLSVGGGTPFGALCFNDIEMERSWEPTLVNRLALVAQVFARALARRQIEQQMASGLQFETLIADLSSAFVNVASDKVDGLILDAQQRVCEFLDLDLSSLWQWKEAPRRCLTPSHIYRPLGGPPVPELLNGEEAFPWSVQKLSAGKTVVEESTDRAPSEAAQDQATWRYFGIKSTVGFPLTPGGEDLLGVLTFHTQRQERSWPEPLVKRLQLIAQIFASALARARADKIIRESESRLNLAADTAALGLWSLNLATRHFWVTERTRQLFALPANEEITFERFMSLVHPEDREFIRKKVESMIESKQEARDEFRIVHPDGSVRWMLAHGRVQCNAAGEPDVLAGATVDITARKQAEIDREQDRKALAHMNRVTTMGVLTSSIAHELNQPLTAILANAQAARRIMSSGAPDMQEIRDILSDIADDDQRAGDVIRRIRELLQKGESSFPVIEMQKFLDDAVRIIRPDALIRNVGVIVEIAPDLPPIHGDRVQLQQVLINLALNAFDAMNNHPGRRELTVRSCRAADGGVEINVEDAGPGIPADKLETIFTPFFTSKPGGLGMGLPICRSIITAHGGRIWAENNSGGGATFHVTLPPADAPKQ